MCNNKPNFVDWLVGYPFHKAKVASFYISVGRLSGYLACMHSYFIVITISVLRWDL